MNLPPTITAYLGKREASYETVAHPRSRLAAELRQAPAPRRQLVKGVLFCDEDSYTLAVVSASSRVDPAALSDLLGLRGLMLASEDELALVFPDCEPGTVPAIGAPYGVPSVVDAALLIEPELFVDAGDSRQLLHLTGNEFRRLMHGISRGVISYRVAPFTTAQAEDPSPCR